MLVEYKPLVPTSSLNSYSNQMQSMHQNLCDHAINSNQNYSKQLERENLWNQRFQQL